MSASDVKPVRCTLMIAGKEVTTVTGDDQQKNDENAAQTDGQSVDSDKKDQSGSDKVTDSKTHQIDTKGIFKILIGVLTYKISKPGKSVCTDTF